jgi:integrase
MARRAEGWKLTEQGGWWYVRYRHQGRRCKVAAGTKDPGEAAKLAPQLYAEAIAGTRRPRRLSAHAAAPLDELVALWLASLEGPGGLAPRSRQSYLDHARAHWLTRWQRLGQLTESALKAYIRERLGLVTRSTVRKEVSGLRGFLGWCRDQELLDAPPVLTLPRRHGGTRADRQQRVPVPLSAGEVRALLAHLPELAPRARPAGGARAGERYPIRAYCEVLWETGLRPATVEALSVPTHWRPGAAALELGDLDDKGRWGRTVPLSARARELLALHAPDHGVIWGRYRVGVYLRAAARAAGIEEARASRLCAYDLRHARITALVDAGGARSGVQLLAGHRHAQTTDRYLHPVAEAAREALALLDVAPEEVCEPAPRACRFGPAIGPSCPAEGPWARVPRGEVCGLARLRSARGGT